LELREQKEWEDGENEGPYYLCMLFMDINEIISLKIMNWVGHAAYMVEVRSSYTILSKIVTRRKHERLCTVQGMHWGMLVGSCKLGNKLLGSRKVGKLIAS
jgi:hypothetical protein